MRKDGTLVYVMGTMRVTEMSDGERIVQTMFMDSGYHVVQGGCEKSRTISSGKFKRTREGYRGIGKSLRCGGNSKKS